MRKPHFIAPISHLGDTHCMSTKNSNNEASSWPLLACLITFGVLLRIANLETDQTTEAESSFQPWMCWIWSFWRGLRKATDQHCLAKVGRSSSCKPQDLFVSKDQMR